MSGRLSNTLGAVANQANDTARPLIDNIFGVSAEFLGELKTWLEQNPPAIPVTQIVGFSQFTIQSATSVNTSETTTSGTYTDLATVGPQLTGIPDGTYVFFFGCTLETSSTTFSAYCGLELNSSSPTSELQIISNSAVFVPGVRVSVGSLSNGGNNTVTAKYRTDGGATGTFSNRYLHALRVSN